MSSSDPPPAYELQRSPGGGRTTPVHANPSTAAGGGLGSFGEDSIDNSTLEPSLAEGGAFEDTILAVDSSGLVDPAAGSGRVDVSQLTEYEGLGRSREESPTDGYDHGYQIDQEGYYADEADGGAEDVTETIRDMHRSLLELMSEPGLFHEGIEWQTKLDSGIDPGAVSDDGGDNNEDDPARNRGPESSVGDGGDSTFDGLDSLEGDGGNDTTTKATEDETFEFDPDAANRPQEEKKKSDEPPPRRRKTEPLPLRIFAPDAEAVLPAAFTATQLFGAEVHTGIELEAAAGVVEMSRLFLRWLALMPEGDHENPIDPPGLTVMRIAGGGYRVTGAHRVVWRWMNVFGPDAYPSSRPPSTPDGGGRGTTTASASDLGLGDLVTMTIVDVFETDSSGRLLSYCPTFDNRSVRRTNESVERMKKTVTQVDDGVRAFARSPAGKIATAAVGQAGRLSMRAAVVVGNAVRNKVRHNLKSGGEEDELGGGEGLVEASISEEERLASLVRSQVTVDDDGGNGVGEDVDMSRLDGSGLVDESGPRSAEV